MCMTPFVDTTIVNGHLRDEESATADIDWPTSTARLMTRCCLLLIHWKIHAPTNKTEKHCDGANKQDVNFDVSRQNISSL